MKTPENDSDSSRGNATVLEIAREIGGGINQGINEVADLVKRHPRESFKVGSGVVLGSVIGVVMIAGMNRVADVMDEASKARARVHATATAIAIDNLKQDYQETGGINLARQQASYLVTLRGSSRFASSDAELIDNALARIKRETECNPGPVVILPEVSGSLPWDPPKVPKSYLIPLVNC